MEIILENKAKFFGYYWGQKVRFWTFNGSDSLSKIGHTYMSKSILKGCALFLKPLSSITDEHVIEVAKILGLTEGDFEISHTDGKINISAYSQDFTIEFDDFLISFDDYDSDFRVAEILYLEAYDYLRSKGYALPWMGLSVDQMVEAGWIKLQTS